jgi:hypothetical protein
LRNVRGFRFGMLRLSAASINEIEVKSIAGLGHQIHGLGVRVVPGGLPGNPLTA